MQKTPIGPSGKKGKRRVFRVHVLNKHRSNKKPPRPRKNFAKRWSHPYPEFGGFQMRGNAGQKKGEGALLIWTRKVKPIGGKGARQHDRAPIETMRTIDPAHMVLGKHTLPLIRAKLKERLPIEFASQMKYLQIQAARRAAK